MELIGIEWIGGFLDGVRLHLNDAMNVLIGGRGSGKSTVIESIRYALDLQPLSEDAKKVASNVQRYVLGNGAKVTLYLKTHTPSPKVFTIERTVPEPPIVRDDSGKTLDVKPSAVFEGIQVYGQHEIGEIAKSGSQMTDLLRRFVEKDENLAVSRINSQKQLESNRNAIVGLSSRIDTLTERLSALPALELKIERFEEMNVQSKLHAKTRLVQEEATIKRAKKLIEPIMQMQRDLKSRLPLDSGFVNQTAREQGGLDAGLEEVEATLLDLSSSLVTLAEGIGSVLSAADARLELAAAQWKLRSEANAEEYAAILRDLQEDNIDGTDYIALQAKLQELRPLNAELAATKSLLQKSQEDRRELLAQWDDVQRQQFALYDSAAKRLSKRLNGRLWVRVLFQADKAPLIRRIEKLGGRTKETKEVIGSDQFSLREFSRSVLDGRSAIRERYPNISEAQAEKLGSADLSFKLELQEIESSHNTEVLLNVGPPQGSVQWRLIDHLSTGQRATAVLLLLLIGTNAPLVIDQPEDDLDNAFISESIVRELRLSKKSRQFVFATHNANIPVLADAELIAGLFPEGEAGSGHAAIPIETVGSIDLPSVRDLVGQVLEGGRDAFDTRRVKYGY
ncbi:MAG TPA: AAA family ATPase [Candidatus Tumulicola sp.]|jgi:ABC-type cobalamin/Fe3+-siderophores transport system ATPase subunit